MTIRRVLIFTPILVIAFLLQSYFWVPTYEEQSKGNPERLIEYITASGGDASILNPILSADSVSSQIESMVFEGLIDRDEDLNFRGRLAKSWEIYEEAFFYVNEEAYISGLGRAGAEEVVGLIMSAKAGSLPVDAELRSSLDNIKDISIIPPQEFTVTRHEKEKEKGKEEKLINIQIRAPARIKLTLADVDQKLFKNLGHLLGADYFNSFPGEKYLSTDLFDKNKGF